jgi:hypothetical protein
MVLTSCSDIAPPSLLETPADLTPPLRCDGIADRLAGHHRLDAVRAHLLEMAGDRDGFQQYA